jgi:uncharacterized protein
MQLLETLRERFNALQTQIRALTDEIATSETGAASDEQQANLDELNGELEALVPRIEHARSMADRMNAGAELLSGVPGGLDDRLDGLRRRALDTGFDTWGEYARATAAGTVDEQVRNDMQRATIALETTALRRALADVTTADVAGLLPPTWLTDIVDFIGTARPFVTAFSQKPLPDSGMTVTYPRISQRPLTAKQAAEKTEVASRDTHIDAQSSPIETYGGGEDMSIQVIERTDPSYLGIVNELYAEELAIDMDLAAIVATSTAVPAGNKLTLSAAAPADINGQFAEGAKLVYAARGVPNTLVMGLDVWAFLSGASDTDGRPLFPNVGPANPLGRTSIADPNGDVRGLTFAVDPNMTPSQAYLGWDRAVTTMLGGLRTMSADVPAKLGRDYAVFEFGAFLIRRPDAVVQYTLGA